ncbi:MAG: DUF2695 domain-containing protein [Lachnospiraceae bacterium]|nr:DUF2695 domain-containing protein [Lachnospiraceae bacterium]MCI9297701.1 DUF2695 domain-containing protein [Lachnospiraceae bacterium]
MAELSKEEKKALMKKWKAAQNKKYILSKTKIQKLFCYLEAQLEHTPCNHTLRYTEQWLKDNLPREKVCGVIAEIKEMGGYCDCEVLMNCYEKYDIN